MSRLRLVSIEATHTSSLSAKVRASGSARILAAAEYCNGRWLGWQFGLTALWLSDALGFEDAIQQGVARASQTLRGIQRAWVKEQHVCVEDGKVVGYQVNLVIRFVLEG